MPERHVKALNETDAIPCGVCETCFEYIKTGEAPPNAAGAWAREGVLRLLDYRLAPTGNVHQVSICTVCNRSGGRREINAFHMYCGREHMNRPDAIVAPAPPVLTTDPPQGQQEEAALSVGESYWESYGWAREVDILMNSLLVDPANVPF